MAEGKFVSYLRVSTDKQGRSGLGLEAQRDAVARYLNGGRWKLVAEYVEVESGKRNSRPQLQAAISHAKATGAKLVIARLDRLARNLHFVSSLQERGVDFVAADMPDANRLTIHIIAAVAESVGRTISENTKTALAAAKARGVKLGNPYGARALRGKQVGNADAVAKLKADATQRALDLEGIVNTLRSKGITSVRSLAGALNEQGIHGNLDFVADGGLMAYFTSIFDTWRQLAKYVDRILKGAKPGELPVQQATKFELIINLKTAKAAGFTIPEAILLRADKVIE
jgi:DNA invertase Pin-like site-specific DNA recombinase